MKSGNLNFLELSGPLQACNGTALPLPLPLPCTVISIWVAQLRRICWLSEQLLASQAEVYSFELDITMKRFIMQLRLLA